jgi:hypothetical protein
MRELNVYEDGSSLLVGEQHYIIQHTTRNANGVTQTTYTYHYNDILAVKIDADGELEWMKKLGKKQTGSSGQGGMSYKYMKGNGAHYFIFLDNVKNLDLALDERPAGHSDGAGGFLTAYKIDDATGAVSKVSLFDLRDVYGINVYQFKIGRIVQTGPNEIIVEVYKKKIF